MNGGSFVHSHEIVNTIGITGEFSVPFVILSILFAIVGSYAAFIMHDRVLNNSFFSKWFWFLMASFALGFGIWAMHYMGMFAYELPISVKFSPFFTTVSIFPIMIAAYVAFYLSYKRPQSKKIGIIASFILAVGVVAMHFLGMKSIEAQTTHLYHLPIMIFALMVSFFAFFMFYTFRSYMHNGKVKLLITFMMGLCFSLTHYSAMLGMEIQVPLSVVINDIATPMVYRNLAAMILTSVFVIIYLLLLVSGFSDKYVHYRAEHYDLLTHLPNLRMFERSIEDKLYSQIAIIQIDELDKKYERSTYLERDQFIMQLVNDFVPKKLKNSEWFRTDYY